MKHLAVGTAVLLVLSVLIFAAIRSDGNELAYISPPSTVSCNTEMGRSLLNADKVSFIQTDTLLRSLWAPQTIYDRETIAQLIDFFNSLQLSPNPDMLPNTTRPGCVYYDRKTIDSRFSISFATVDKKNTNI